MLGLLFTSVKSSDKTHTYVYEENLQFAIEEIPHGFFKGRSDRKRAEIIPNFS